VRDDEREDRKIRDEAKPADAETAKRRGRTSTSLRTGSWSVTACPGVAPAAAPSSTLLTRMTTLRTRAAVLAPVPAAVGCCPFARVIRGSFSLMPG
jgi:hypothetical protein